MLGHKKCIVGSGAQLYDSNMFFGTVERAEWDKAADETDYQVVLWRDLASFIY
jgi:hypothetical protein